VDDTGRIRRPLAPTARRVVFGATGEAREAELCLVSEVDRAHLVMLVERGLVRPEAARALLAEIAKLRALDFAPLREREARRGLFFLYEDWLVSRLGERTAGILRTGRSRNDLNATVLLLRLRAPYQRLMDELLRLQAVVLRGARRHVAVVMPAYTHYQAAFPVTLGHYLAGIAIALDRDVDPLARLDFALARCPLGAGAGGGTVLPIDPGRTAALLGFERPVTHSIDAVASRDLVLRLLAGTAVLGVTLSRLAADLLLWTTGEFGFLLLPDELVGSSSLMPQKRNPFLLEHAKGRAAVPLGAFVAAATSMHATPFANSIAVGTEGCSSVVGALGAAADVAALLRLVVSGAKPVPAAMLGRAREGQTTATALADRLVADQGMSFREAHRLVGAMLGGGATAGVSSVDTAGLSLDDLDPVAVATAARYGGGPGAAVSLDGPMRRRTAWAAQRAGRDRRWRRAAAALEAAVARLESGADDGTDRPGELLARH
jgi:argininosuccinate lyase